MILFYSFSFEIYENVKFDFYYIRIFFRQRLDIAEIIEFIYYLSKIIYILRFVIAFVFFRISEQFYLKHPVAVRQ